MEKRREEKAADDWIEHWTGAYEPDHCGAVSTPFVRREEVVADKRRYEEKSAYKWIKYWAGTYKRDEHDVILDEPFVIEKFEINGKLYLKCGDNYLY